MHQKACFRLIIINTRFHLSTEDRPVDNAKKSEKYASAGGLVGKWEQAI